MRIILVIVPSVAVLYYSVTMVSDREQLEHLRTLLHEVSTSDQSAFYIDHFRTEGFEPKISKDPEILDCIPILQWETLVQTPFLKRLYRNSQLYTKIVSGRSHNKPILIARTTEDISEEHFGTIQTRPLVLFGTIHESIEKCLWVYEQNILPLVCTEGSGELTARTALQYGIDSILCDMGSFKEVSPHLSDYLIENEVHVSVVDTAFDMSFLNTRVPQHHYTLTLGLPEVGTIAHACPETHGCDSIVFHPDERSIIEILDTLIVTRLVNLPTPIIRYQTDIKAKSLPQTCRCKEHLSFSLS